MKKNSIRWPRFILIQQLKLVLYPVSEFTSKILPVTSYTGFLAWSSSFVSFYSFFGRKVQHAPTLDTAILARLQVNCHWAQWNQKQQNIQLCQAYAHPLQSNWPDKVWGFLSQCNCGLHKNRVKLWTLSSNSLIRCWIRSLIIVPWIFLTVYVWPQLILKIMIPVSLSVSS